MADNAQKIPFGRSLQELARRKVLEHVQLMSGRAPATLVKATDKTNTIWMVKFDTDGTYTLPQVTIPVHGSEFSRVPYQKDAKGFVSTADFDIGAMTGLGATSGPASFTRPANLAGLLWHPVGNTKFSPTDNPNAHVHYGPEGTISRDTEKKSRMSTHPTNGVMMATGLLAEALDHVMMAHPTAGITHQSIAQVLSQVAGSLHLMKPGGINVSAIKHLLNCD